jgi:hypothetical protein
MGPEQRTVEPAQEQLRTAVVRRLKSEITDDFGRLKFAKRMEMTKITS